jgi:DNA replication protein DnaC
LASQYALQLRLPTIGGQFLKMAEEAVKQKLAHVAYLEALLAAEVEERERNAIARRIQEAKFPKVKTLEDFHFQEVSAHSRGADPQTGRGRLPRPERIDHFLRRHWRRRCC